MKLQRKWENAQSLHGPSSEPPGVSDMHLGWHRGSRVRSRTARRVDGIAGCWGHVFKPDA